MGYLGANQMKTLKANIDETIKNNDINRRDLASFLEISQRELDQRLDIKSYREVTPKMYKEFLIFMAANNIESSKDLLGGLPEEYGDRLKYFIFKHDKSADKFAKETGISPSLLSDFVSGKKIVDSRYEEKMCKVLSIEEFNKLSPWTDISLEIERDREVLNGANFSYYINSHKRFNMATKLMEKLNITDKKDKKAFLSGHYKITGRTMTAINNLLGEGENGFEDRLGIKNPENKFGYFLASKLFEKNNSIKEFATRCSLPYKLITDAIKGEALLEENDAYNIASRLELDGIIFWSICPKELPKTKNIEEIKEEDSNMVKPRGRNGGRKAIMTPLRIAFNEAVARDGFTVEEFAELMDWGMSNLNKCLAVGNLPAKNREKAVEELDLYEFFSEYKNALPDTTIEKVLANPISMNELEEMCKEDVEDNKSNPIPISPLDSDPVEPEKEIEIIDNIDRSSIYPRTMKEFEMKVNADGTKMEAHEMKDEMKEITKETICLSDNDKIDILVLMNNMGITDQINIIKLLCKVSNIPLSEELMREDIIGSTTRMSLINDLIK